jgi:putative transposase
MASEKLPIEVACRVLGIPVSSFYARRHRSPSARAICHAWLTDLIRQIHRDSRGTYGARRIYAELRLGHGIAVGHSAVEMLMSHAGIRAVTRRRRSRRIAELATADDLVERQFARHDPDQPWVTDITQASDPQRASSTAPSCLTSSRGAWSAGQSTHHRPQPLSPMPSAWRSMGAGPRAP